MGTLKIGCALWTLGATPDVATLQKHMQAVAGIGVTSVQPWAVNEGFTPCILDPDLGTAQDRRDAARAAGDLGLSFSGFCAQLMGSRTFGGLEEEDRLQGRIDKTRAVLDIAAEMGGPIVSTHVGEMPEDENAPAYKTLLKSCGEIARHGEQAGAFFAMETGQEKPEVMKRFIERVGSPNLKINYDPCNLLRYGSEEGTIEGVHTLKDHIIHTHAKDWNPKTLRATCGQGGVPWKGYIAALKEIGYEGWYAIEDETGAEDMLGSIRQSFEFLQQF